MNTKESLNYRYLCGFLEFSSTFFFFLPEAGHDPGLREISSMAMSPASPPTNASRITWWTFCRFTWLWTRSHSSPWFPDFCHTYRKDRRLIHSSQWGCEEDFCNTAVCSKIVHPALIMPCINVILQSAFHNYVKSIITQRKLSGASHKYFSIAHTDVFLAVKGSNVSRRELNH